MRFGPGVHLLLHPRHPRLVKLPLRLRLGEVAAAARGRQQADEAVAIADGKRVALLLRAGEACQYGNLFRGGMPQL